MEAPRTQRFNLGKLCLRNAPGIVVRGGCHQRNASCAVFFADDDGIR